MDTRLYHLDCRILLTPVNSPDAIVTFNNDVIYAGKIYNPTVITIDQQLPANDYRLMIEHINKDNLDNSTALIVDSITFNRISDNKFVWAGTFFPNYPEPWASEQKNSLKTQLPAHNYLGWNGKWVLIFSLPVFTWMHKTLDLGWIYD